MTQTSLIVLPLIWLLRVISAVTGFVIGFGALFFFGSTGTPLSTLLELLAGVGSSVAAFLPMRSMMNAFGRGVFLSVAILTLINALIAASGYLGGQLGIDVLLWSGPNAFAVVLLCVAAWFISNSRQATSVPPPAK